jgi:hypothetical protein
MGFPRDHSLIGDAHSRVDVDPDELGSNGRRNRQGAPRIVAQDIHSEGMSETSPHLLAEDRQESHRMRRDATRIIRRIAEILQQEPIHSALGERFGIGQNSRAHALPIAFESRSPRQSRRMKHADDGLLDAEDVTERPHAAQSTTPTRRAQER